MEDLFDEKLLEAIRLAEALQDGQSEEKESEGKKRGILAFWHNYGDSASDEDFFFDWEDGKWDYELTGSRSGKQFLVNFTPTEAGMQIKVTCTEGAYYSWETGQSAAEWVNAEYVVK